MKFNIITIFPKIFDSFLNESLIKRAQKEKLIDIKTHDLRKWTSDKHKTVDDTPYGGGAGMLMKIEPLYKSLMSLKSIAKGKKCKTVLLTPAGKQFTQKKAEEYSQLDEITFICGRYEGFDARIDNFIDEKISIGPYVLNGGEVAAMAIIESVFRLIPGTIGNIDSLKEETHGKIESLKSKVENYKAEYPQYTRPEIFDANGKKYRVPKVLLSGNHKKIKEWREKKSKTR